jgi:hypothetical protein
VYPVIRRIVESGCTDFAARSIMTRSWSRIRPTDGVLSLVGRALRQRQNPLSFRTVIERMEAPNLI